MLRSVIAIVSGFLTTVVLAVGADAVVHILAPQQFSASMRTSSPALLCLALAYSALFAIVGSYVAARLAPRHPQKHALILGGIAFLITLLVSVAAWQSAPAWYHMVALVVILPAAWLGGRLRERQIAASPRKA